MRALQPTWLFVVMAFGVACSDKTTQPVVEAIDALADMDVGLLDAPAADAPLAQDATAEVVEDAGPEVDGGFDPMGDCYSCHGTVDNGNPAPPVGTGGEVDTSQLAVGAHQNHLKVSPWHRQVQCQDCHPVPTLLKHKNGVIDFAWSSVATAMASAPSYVEGTATCSGAYCHGGTLFDAASVKTKPVWTQVDGTFNSCGAACHMTPPGGPHPANSNCAACHGAVIASFDAKTQIATWKDATLHVNGQIEVTAMSCTDCHGDPASNNPAPPLGTHGETQTSQPAVGAHAQHLATSTWHRQVACTDCHAVPTLTTHANGVVDFAWSSVATAMGETPQFDATVQRCSGAYCHGEALPDSPAAKKQPIWTQVDGTFNACGASCHATPPQGKHPQSLNCTMCHGDVIASFDPVKQTATWTNAALHVNGQVELKSLTCTSCHGDAASNNPAPPTGTKGETKTSEPAVGAHAQHLATSAWHREVVCTDCHAVPTSMTHANSVVDFVWSAVATAMGATPKWDATTNGCSGAYCHGGQLFDAATAKTQPVWTQVDGTFNACGAACHMTPPGPPHAQATDCATCHAAVIASFNPATSAATWANLSLHIDGIVQSSGYHTLANWVAPKDQANGVPNPNHHGFAYFLSNQGKDDKGKACTDCHGTDYGGGTAGISCNNSTVNCHGANPAGNTGGDWHACNFCHGGPNQQNPPTGVANETTTQTLAVGRHVAHLTASATHLAFACPQCHVVPAAGNLTHTQLYVPSGDLSTAGHHGVVTFAPPSTALNTSGNMTWDVNAVAGAPVTARGTCTGACHSDGAGGPPNVVPHWAGGAWSSGSCSNCHDAAPMTGHHGDHVGGDVTLDCSVCHPGTNSGSHLNGLRDVNGKPTDPQGQGSVTATMPTSGKCVGTVQCNGSCHGQNHNSQCW